MGVNDGGAGAMPGCSARLQAPFNAASIQTLRMAPSFALSFERSCCPAQKDQNHCLKSVLAKWLLA
jgi:hypothetical protein